MPLNLSAALANRLQRLHGADQVLWLYELEVPSTPRTRYRFVANTEPVQFGVNPITGEPNIYSPAAIKHGGLEQDRDGGQPEIEITIAAHAFDLVQEMDRWDGFDDAPLEIILVHAQSLAIPARAVRFPGRVLRSKVVAGPTPGAVFAVAAHNLYQSFLPQFRYPASSCGWGVFGSLGCGYVIPENPTNVIGGGFDFCPKDLGGCKNRGADEAARSVEVLHPRRMRIFRGTRQ